ncbi:MAG: PAS domain S-box protein [Chthoniobacter sp.]|uniref:PAS domain-containing sensor histidine kinase n=1 Tax=Chthoniobacter sp. TaxID=2510640 RepID=UPI0032AA3914
MAASLLAQADDGTPNLSLMAFAVMGLLVAAVVILSSWRWRRDWARTRIREQWLATMLRSIDDGVIATDAAGRVTFMNHVAQKLTGWKEDEAIQTPLVKVFQTLDRQARQPTENPIDLVVREGRTTTALEPVLLVARDGAERSVLSKAAPIRGAGDKVTGVVFVFHDVTQRELGESALRASQEMFRLITDHISDLIAVLDLEGRRLYTSESHAQFLAPTRELYLTSIFEEIHPDDREGIRSLFTEIVFTGAGHRAEFRLIGRNEEVFNIESVITVIRDKEGKAEKVLMVSRDISDRRRAEERVRSEMEFSNTLINSMPGIFYLYDARRKILRWNKNLERVTGYTSQEIDTLDPLTYFPDDEKPVVHERMLHCFTTGSADIGVNLLAKDGRRTPFYVTGFRLEVDGHPCMLGIGINISARLAAEEALRATMLRLTRQNVALGEKARNAGSLGAHLGDSLRTITELAAQTLDVSRASIWFYNDDQTKMRCADLFESDRGQHSSGVELAAADFPAYFQALAEERAIAADDASTDPRTCEFDATYLRPLNIGAMLDAPIRGSGRMVGVICHEHTGQPRSWQPDEESFAGSMADLVALSLEVEQRRQAETALRETLDNLEHKVTERTRDLAAANARLKELDHLKSEFLATMSHELRTPLNSIIGFTGILRQGLAGPMNDEQKKQLGMVHSSARHLLGLINDLLDLSRIESGKMELFVEDFAVADLVNEIAQILAPQVEQKKLHLETAIDQPALRMRADRKKCFQILLNLANNAVKFTDVGRVVLKVSSDPTNVTFLVQDTGIGIKTDNLTHLFEAFRQVDGSARRVYEGTGLGLYLSKQLARMLGGHISVESEFGVGSRFTLALPQYPSPANHHP